MDPQRARAILTADLPPDTMSRRPTRDWSQHVMSREAIQYEALQPSHLAGAVALCRELGWPSYSDPAIARMAFSAPGAVTWVALYEGEVVGLVHLLSNGVVHAHLSLVGVASERRRGGIARELVTRAFRCAGAKWLDLCADAGSEQFYRSFQHREGSGFRIYPGEPAA
jgi:ribosomal protein S18 acetylase RimI-like enzyme